MSQLTPLDIENAVFKVGMRGYDRNEVELFRSAVLQAVGDYTTQIAQYRSRIAELESQLRTYKESEDLLKSSVMLAQKTGEDLAHAARAQAETIIAQARLEADQIRAGLADLQSQRERFEYEFYGLLSGFMARLEHHNPQLLPAQPEAPARPHSAPMLAEAGPQPASRETPARQPAVFSPPAASAPAAESEPQRDLDIDAFSAALSGARPVEPGVPALRSSHGTAAELRHESWEDVEPDVDEPEADPYNEGDDEWLEEDLDDDMAAYAVSGAADDPAIYEDEALTKDDGALEVPVLAEIQPASASPTGSAVAVEDYDDEPLENIELPGPVRSAQLFDPAAAAVDAEAVHESAGAGEGADADDETPRPSGLTVHPVEDDEDEDEDGGPRVRRTSRWH